MSEIPTDCILFALQKSFKRSGFLVKGNINRGKQVFILMEVIKENWIEVNPLNHNKDDI